MDFKNWSDAKKIIDFSYPWKETKSPHTSFSAFYDENHIHFRFEAHGTTPIVFVENNNKMEVINSERVEIFFRTNEKMNPYYCLEIDPLGRVLDYKAKHYREFDRQWKWPEPLEIKTIIQNQKYIVEGKISLSVLSNLKLINNNCIQIGLFRGQCEKILDKKASINWISWIDSKTKNPDFHVPSAFGVLKLN